MITIIEPPLKDAEYVTNLFFDLIQSRTSIDKIRLDNLAWLYGHQWAEWNQNLRVYNNYLMRATDDRCRLTINKLPMIMEARTSFIIGRNPSIFVDTTSPETVDKNSALTAQRVCRADWAQDKMFGKVVDTWEWTKACGNSFGQIYFDPGAGKYIGKSKNGSPLFEGQVKYRTRSPLELVYDPLARVWDDVNYVIAGTIFTRERFESQFPDVKISDEDLDRGMTNWTAVPFYDQYLQLNANYKMHSDDFRTKEGKKRAILVLEYWEKPSKQYPHGRYEVIVNKKSIISAQLEVDEIPIVMFGDLHEAGKIECNTPVTNMRPLQENFNRVVSLAIERMQMPDVYYFPMGGGWPTKFGSRSVITGTYNQAMGPPGFLQGGVIRQDYILQMEYLERQMENIAGVSSLATRQKASGGMSGRLGYIVTESNRELLQNISEEFRQSVEDVVRLRLKYIKAYYTEERTMMFINEYDRREIVQFKGSNIGDNYAVRIRLANNMEDPIARSMRLLQLSQNQLIVGELIKNDVAFRKFLEGIDSELAHELFVSESDVDVAQGENFDMSQGGLPPIHWYDDHIIHLKEHTRQIKSDETRTWQPNYRWNLELHTLSHKYKMENDMLEQALKAQQMGGMAGAPIMSSRQQPTPRGVAPLPAGPETPVQAIDLVNEMRTKARFPGASQVPAQQA